MRGSWSWGEVFVAAVDNSLVFWSDTGGSVVVVGIWTGRLGSWSVVGGWWNVWSVVLRVDISCWYVDGWWSFVFFFSSVASCTGGTVSTEYWSVSESVYVGP